MNDNGAASYKMVGHKFGMLTVTAISRLPKRRATAECICDCGKPCTRMAYRVRSGRTKSCGCLFSKTAGCENSRFRHGQAKERTQAYRTWECMKERCLNPNKKQFAHYGGRGISICDRWMSFGNFFADMGERPSGMSLDRIDNDKGYSPDNCRWASKKTQARNTRSNHFVEFKGKTFTITEWSEITGINSHTLFKRFRSGWPVEKALTPIKKEKV